jgi:phage/plasmid-associated DNA primase
MNQPVPKRGAKENYYSLKVAFVVYFGRKYVFANGCWYHFQGPHWVDLGKDAKPHILKLVRTTFFDKVIQPIVAYYRGKLRKRSRTYEKYMPENIEFHFNEFQFTRIDSAFTNLEADFFKPNSWTEELGANQFLLGFKCGHKYDTRTAEYTVAEPEDMIIKVLPHIKAEVEHVEHSKEAYLRKFFREIQPYTDADDPRIHEGERFMIDLFSLIVSGIRTDQIFLIFQGGGSNGKTMLEVLLISMLKDYCVTPDIKLLTGKSGDAEGTDSKLMQCRGALVAVFQEPHGRDKLNSGKMKKYSGGDRVQARELYKQATQIKFTPLMIICCNMSLNFDDTSEGILRRPRFVPFPTTFVESTDPRYDPLHPDPRYKLVNPAVETNFKCHTWGAQMLRIALENLKGMRIRHEQRQAVEGTCKFLFIPKYVQEATIDFKEEKVPIKFFVADRLQFVGRKGRDGSPLKPQCSISKTDMWNEFKDWVKDEGAAYDDIQSWNPLMLHTALATQNVMYSNDGPDTDKNNRKKAYWNWRVKCGENAVERGSSPIDAGPSTRSPLASLINNAI